ncbi:hypothetical protein [Lysobacter capsici]|uniref:hypothetical protein n=1 Tax=Lysobacter capsici TaxID=435897 RepID=UPI001C001C33|nr:hypothetical protein [Lysobacter capsici]QWF15120.1 hypothetical protein KME82_15060 [Lysobacter capsici]
MTVQDRFKQSIVTTLAKRAANCCSNPECRAVTSGPTVDAHDSVNVGEAAHIYGANPGSARYDPEMESVDRSSITNAIWLCANCHKIVDDDPNRYPAGLLYEWQREHEGWIARQIGKVSAQVRQRYEKRHLEDLGKLSYLAERLILEKGEYWEYLLTAEVLRQEIAPIVRRWSALKNGLYVGPYVRIKREDFLAWISGKSDEILRIVNALSALTNVEFSRSWGKPGIAGNDIDIVSTCRLYGEVCSSALAWEESVRFTHVDEEFVEIRDLYAGVAGDVFEQVEKIPKFITDVFDGEPVAGTYNLTLDIGLPEGWSDAVEAAMLRAGRALGGRV